jgi:dihydrofolate reductase
MGRLIAGMQISLDGYFEGPDGYADWVGAWEDTYDLIPQLGACLLGGKMYPGYEQYWTAVQANPSAPLPFGGGRATPGEIAYAEFASHTPHIVLSNTLTSVQWTNTRLIRRIEDVHDLKRRQPKDIYVVGGGTLIASLINLGWLDELRLTVHPLLAAEGKRLFDRIEQRHALDLVETARLDSGRVSLTYRLPQ